MIMALFIWFVAIHHLQCRCRGYVQSTHHAAISPWLAVPVDGGDGPQTYLWINQKDYIYDPSPIFMIY